LNLGTISVFHALTANPTNWQEATVYIDTSFALRHVKYSGSKFDEEECTNFSTFLVQSGGLLVASPKVYEEISSVVEAEHIKRAKKRLGLPKRTDKKTVIAQSPGLLGQAHQDFLRIIQPLKNNPNIVDISAQYNDSDAFGILNRGEAQTYDAVHFATAKYNSLSALITYDGDFANITDNSVQVVLGTAKYIDLCVQQQIPVEHSVMNYYITTMRKLGFTPRSDFTSYTNLI